MSGIKAVFSAVFSGFLLLLLLCFPSFARQGAASSLRAFALTVLPSVFPGMVINLCLLYTGAADALTPITKKLCRLFHLPKELGGVLVLSWFSGAPTGARLLAAREPSAQTALRFLSVSTVLSPLYCISVLGSPAAGMMLYAVLLVSGLLTGLFCRGHGAPPPLPAHPLQPVSFPRALPKALSAASLSCLTVGGSMALFGALRGIFSALPIEDALHRVTLFFLPRAVLSPLLSGLMEVSLGASSCLAAPLPEALRLSLLSGLFAFGGLSMAMQTAAFLPQLSLKDYLLQRLLHGSLSFALCRILTCLPFFSVPAFASFSVSSEKAPVSLFVTGLLFSSALLPFLFLKKHKKQG